MSLHIVRSAPDHRFNRDVTRPDAMPREFESIQDEIEYYPRLHPGSGLSRPSRGPSRGLLLVLITTTAAAWALLVPYARSMGATMDIAVRGPSIGGMEMSSAMTTAWSFPGALMFVMMWTLMMVAMMLPSATPTISIFAAKQARTARGTAAPMSIFVAAYFGVWAFVGVLAYLLVQAVSDVATALAPSERAEWAPLALAATLLLAGLYQFTPAKRACLRHCRVPFGFLLRHWRDGNWGALQMGLRHGAYCVGCCWALLTVLTAVGVMSVAWMLMLTLLIFVEQVLPQSPISSMTIGFLFVGLSLAVGSGSIPMPLVG
jgi:predicted metal-binding membrane protein